MSTSFDVRFTDSSGAKLSLSQLLGYPSQFLYQTLKMKEAEEKKHFLQNFNHLYLAAQLNSVDIL